MSAVVKGKSAWPIRVKNCCWGFNEHESAIASWNVRNKAQINLMADDILSGRLDMKDYFNPERIICNLIRNTLLPFEKAMLLQMASCNDFCLAELCARPDTTAEFLDECADGASQFVARRIAHHNNVNPATVIKMTKSSDPSVVYTTLWSRHLPDEILDSFATSDQMAFRMTVAERSKTPKILAKLAFDDWSWVRIQAVKNSKIEMTVLDQVALTDPDLEIATLATEKINNPEVLRRIFDILWRNNEARLADALLKNENLPEDIRCTIALMRPNLD